MSHTRYNIYSYISSVALKSKAGVWLQVDRERGDVEGDAFGEFADDFIPAESQPHLAVFTGPQQTEETASSDHRVPKLISSKPAKVQVLAQLPGIQG